MLKTKNIPFFPKTYFSYHILISVNSITIHQTLKPKTLMIPFLSLPTSIQSCYFFRNSKTGFKDITSTQILILIQNTVRTNQMFTLPPVSLFHTTGVTSYFLKKICTFS